MRILKTFFIPYKNKADAYRDILKSIYLLKNYLFIFYLKENVLNLQYLPMKDCSFFTIN